jgi:hypothetical protein
MNIFRTPLRYPHLKRIGIFLIALALIAVIVGCDGDGPKYSLTMAVAPSGGGTATDLTGTSPYVAGTSVSIKAVANPGYEFVSWAAPAGTFADSNSAETTFTTPAQDVTVTASFVTVYDLTMAANPGSGGTATDLTDDSPYPVGTVVDIKAVAASGYRFVDWTAPAGTFGDPNAAETTFDIPAQNVTVTANFVAVYDLTMATNPVGGGTATDLTDDSPYPASTVVDIKAIAAPGYRFIDWSAPAGTFTNATATETTFTIPAQNVVVTANFVAVYDLTMAVNPVGGGTATDLTGSSPYAAGTAVSINAVAAIGYEFVMWTAPAGTFADPNAATTTFTMPAQDMTVTANLVGPLDHFTCYFVDEEAMPYIGEVVYLEDQFGAINATVEYGVLFNNAAEKMLGEVLTPIFNPDHHVTLYTISYEEEPRTWLVEVDNQFGTQQLTVSGPTLLAVPTQKVEPGDHKPPFGLDHFLLYDVIAAEPVDTVVDLNDQFGSDPDVLVSSPLFFGNPVRKTHGDEVTEIMHPDRHIVGYWIDGEYYEQEVQVFNQFGEQTLDVDGPYLLAVPSEKLSFAPMLDHFKCYSASDVTGLPIGEDVYLEDQFGTVNATVQLATAFGNPAEKLHGEMPTPILHPDHHLTIYDVDCAEAQMWAVEIDNQFGMQNLAIFGPVALAVPTQKESHEPPEYLDHFLVYQVFPSPSLDVIVSLTDQFGFQQETYVTQPVFFANPVLKIHGETLTETVNPEAHLVFYQIFGEPFALPELQIVNQFGPQTLEVHDPALLAVPSLKLYYEPIL